MNRVKDFLNYPIPLWVVFFGTTFGVLLMNVIFH